MSTSPTQDQDLHNTPLHDLHIELGGKMVPFTGYSLPVQYATGIKKEHIHTREQAGLFDVSHMGQVVIKGAGAAQALESLIPSDLTVLENFKQSYGVLTSESGGILDDLIVTRWAEDEFFLVINAACKDQDIAHLQQHLGNLTIDVIQNRALLALQGPKAQEVMKELAPQAVELTFMNGCWATIKLGDSNADCFITRSGYTGEDGFELSIPADQAVAIAKRILSFEGVLPIGLGARDSLRLEAGLCLYGHDMDENTTPIEAGLIWTISKSRRAEGAKEGGFLGSDKILDHIKNGAPRKRVGFNIEGRAPVREDTEIVNSDNQVIGKVTSGGFGPSIEGPVAMGYVDIAYTALDTAVFAMVRNKKIPMTVTKMPFVKKTYAR